MSVAPVPFRIVLDASALVEYSRSSIHVGEILAEIADEPDALAIIPLPCLVEAAHQLGDNSHLQVLTGLPSTVVLAPDADHWLEFAAAYDIVGSPDAAHAALLALDAEVPVLTRHPGIYAGMDDGGLTILIGE